MESKSSPREMPPGFHLSGLPSLFESEYGPAAAKAANQYCKDKNNLGLRELGHELRTALKSLTGAAARLTLNSDVPSQVGESLELRQRIRVLNRFARQLDDITASGTRVTYSKTSIQQVLTEAYEIVSSQLKNEGINDTGLKLCGDDFFATIAHRHLLKILTYVIRSVVLSQYQKKSKHSLNIRFSRTTLSATIEI